MTNHFVGINKMVDKDMQKSLWIYQNYYQYFVMFI